MLPMQIINSYLSHLSMVKNERRQEAAKKAAKRNPWIQHVKQVAKERALTYKLGLASCKENYKKKPIKSEPSRGKESLQGAAPIKNKVEKVRAPMDECKVCKQKITVK